MKDDVKNLPVLKAKRFGVYTCHEWGTLKDAAKLMDERNISSLVVVGDEGQLRGIITRSDLVRACYTQAEWASQKVETCMNADVVTVELDEDNHQQIHVRRGDQPEASPPLPHVHCSYIVPTHYTDTALNRSAALTFYFTAAALLRYSPPSWYPSLLPPAALLISASWYPSLASPLAARSWRAASACSTACLRRCCPTSPPTSPSRCSSSSRWGSCSWHRGRYPLTV